MNVVITGASRGIGLAVARLFARHGHDLFLSARREYPLLQAIEGLQKDFPNLRIDGKALDLGKKSEAQLLAQWVSHETGTVDVLVNNAGTFVPGNVSDEPEGALEDVMAVNLYSAYHLTRALLPRMTEAGSGHIFNICSIASLKAYPGGGAYSISKYALLGFTRNLRQELQPKGLRVTAVLPGATYTDSWKESGLPPSRFMEAEDIAQMIYAATQLSPGAVVEDIVLRPQAGDI